MGEIVDDKDAYDFSIMKYQCNKEDASADKSKEYCEGIWMQILSMELFRWWW